MALPEENTLKYVCYLIKKCTVILVIYVSENKAILDNTTLYCSLRACRNKEGNLFGNF